MINLSTFADAYTAFTNSGFFEMVDADQIDDIVHDAYHAAPGNGYVSEDDASELFREAIIEVCGWDASDF